MKRLFLDLETTGLAPTYACILEIAAIVVDDEGGDPKVVDVFHEYIRPFRGVPKEITDITGITNEMVAHCKCESEVLNNFMMWLIGNEYDKLDSVAHNGKFDFRFLKGRSKDAEVFVNMEKKLIDTLPMARKLIKAGKLETEKGRAKLEVLAKAFDINYNAHSALEDTQALAKVFYKMMTL